MQSQRWYLVASGHIVSTGYATKAAALESFTTNRQVRYLDPASVDLVQVQQAQTVADATRQQQEERKRGVAREHKRRAEAQAEFEEKMSRLPEYTPRYWQVRPYDDCFLWNREGTHDFDYCIKQGGDNDCARDWAIDPEYYRVFERQEPGKERPVRYAVYPRAFFESDCWPTLPAQASSSTTTSQTSKRRLSSRSQSPRRTKQARTLEELTM